MKSYFKILLILLFSIFVTVFVTPIIAGVCSFSFYRIMSRVVLLVTFLMFFYYKDRLGIRSIKELGFANNIKWWLLLLLGFIIGLLSIGIIAGVMCYSSIRFVIPDVASINWTKHIAGYLAAGLLVALIEECFFRGFIFQSLRKDTKFIPALLITNIFYSAVHFMKPESKEALGQLNLFSSIGALPLFFKPLIANIAQIWPSLLGLFLVGVVLTMAYMRVKSLSLPIGIHAGFILGIKSLSLGTDSTLSGPLWLTGNVIEYPFSWILLGILILLLGQRIKH